MIATTAETLDTPAGASPLTLRRPGGPDAAARKYGAIFSTTLRDQLAYLGEMALRTAFLVIILYVFLEHHLSRGDYRRDGNDNRGRWRAGRPGVLRNERREPAP